MLGSTLFSYESRNMDSTRISRSHLWSMVRNAGSDSLPTNHRELCLCSPQWLNSALVSVPVRVGFLSDSESSDRGESSVTAGPRVSTTGEQTSPSLHIPRGPTSTHPVALASLPVQRPVSSLEAQCAHNNVTSKMSSKPSETVVHLIWTHKPRTLEII